MNQGILSPTLIDLSELQKCSISSLSKALMNKSFGVLAGSLLGGIVADKWRPRADIYIAMATLVGGLSIAAVPWCPTLVILGLVMFMQGLTQGSLNVGEYSTRINMFILMTHKHDNCILPRVMGVVSPLDLWSLGDTRPMTLENTTRSG